METVILQVKALRKKLYGDSDITGNSIEGKLNGDSDITGNSTDGKALWRE